MILLIMLVYLLLFLLASFIILLLIPIRYHAEGIKSDDVPLSINVELSYGPVTYKYRAGTDCGIEHTLKVFGIPLSIKHKEGKKGIGKASHKHKKEKKGMGKLPGKAFLDEALKSLWKLLNHLRFRRCDINCTFGLEDPADTAVLWLIICSLPLYGESRSIRLEPVFDDQILEGDFHIQGHLIPAVAAYIVLRFILSKPVRNIIKNKKERKNHVIKFRRKREHQPAV